MKKILTILCFVIIAASFSACSGTMKGADQLIKKAREEIPVSESGTIDIEYAGAYTKDKAALLWFISGNEYQAHYYLPMECEIVGEDEYKFVHSYKPIQRSADIAALQWKDGYCFLVNNPSCTAIQLTDSEGNTEIIEIGKGAYPFIYGYEGIPAEYLFLDANGDSIE